MYALGSCVVTFGNYSPMISSRSTRAARADQFDHYSVRLNLASSGCAKVDIDGRRFVAAPGDAVVTDLARPSTYHSPGGFVTHLFVPRVALEKLLSPHIDLHGRVPNGPCARLLVDHLFSLTRNLPALTVDGAADVATATIGLLAASLGAMPRTLEHARPAIESALSRQVRAYIDRHLTDRQLAVPQVCGAFRISRSTLYRLFEPLGGVAHYVKVRRPRRIHAVLTSPDQVSRQLATIAEEFGFKSAGHFSRAFREQFGYPPGEVRRSRVPRHAGGAGLPSHYDFDAWMQSLRG